MFLTNQQVTEGIKREISRNKWQWQHDNSKPMGSSNISSKTEVYSHTILPQETRKHWLDNLNLHLKQEQKDPKEKKNKKPPKFVEEKKL